MTTQPEARAVIVGVDTHKHVHVAVVIDTRGIRLGGQSFVADAGGYRALLTWADTPGRIEAFGIEGTGSYGAGLARAVRHAGHRVAEVNRSDRRLRRAAGTSDTIDAEAAARAVLAGQSTAIPKTADGAGEMMRLLKIARDTAVKARTTAMITLKQIVVNMSPALRETLQDLTDQALLTRCAGLRSGPLDTPTASAKHTLRALARRWIALADEITTHDRHLARLMRRRPPSVRASVSAPARRPKCSSSSAITQTGFTRTPPSRSCAARVRSRPRPGEPPAGTASLGVATDRRTPHSIAASSSACDSTTRPSHTSHDARPTAGPNARSSGASNASWPAKSTSGS